MNNEETHMDDDDRFVLRRGTEGNEWATLGRVPDDPEPPKPGALVRVGSAIGGTGRWMRTRLGALGGGLRRSKKAPAEAPVQPEEPGHGWAPMPPLPEDPRVAVPWSKVAPPRLKMTGFRERFVTNRPRVAIPWAKIALSRPKIGPAKTPRVAEPKVNAQKMPSIAVPRPELPSVAVPKPKLPAPHLPRVKAPRMPKMRAPIVTFSGLAGLRAFRVSGVREDMRGPLAVFGGLALAALIALGAIIAIEAIGGGGDGALVIATETPQVTETPQGTPGETPIETAPPTGQPSVTEPPPTTTGVPPTIAPTAPPTAPPTAAPGGVPVVPPPGSAPQGGVGVAYWSNSLGRWWFGDLTDSVATYEEGQAVPFMVRWEGAAGATYTLRITFDCEVPNVFGALDYLSGVQNYGDFSTASYGPGSGRPDGAIPVPDTPNFKPDDGDSGVFWLWNAKFSVLPQPPHPGDNCRGQRTLDLAIQAFGGPIVFLGSGHLGSASVYSSGQGASSAAQPFGLHISVDGVGAVNVLIDPSAVADAER